MPRALVSFLLESFRRRVVAVPDPLQLRNEGVTGCEESSVHEIVMGLVSSQRLIRLALIARVIAQPLPALLEVQPMVLGPSLELPVLCVRVPLHRAPCVLATPSKPVRKTAFP